MSTSKFQDLSFNFQDTAGRNSFSRTFQVLEILEKNSRTFQQAWEPCHNTLNQLHGIWKSHHLENYSLSDTSFLATFSSSLLTYCAVFPAIMNAAQKPTNQNLSHILTRKTALNRGQTERISMTHDLDLQFPVSYGHDPTCTQNFEVNNQSVPKIESKQRDRWRWVHYVPR